MTATSEKQLAFHLDIWEEKKMKIVKIKKKI